MPAEIDTDEHLHDAWGNRGSTIGSLCCRSCRLTIGLIATTDAGLIARVDDALHRRDDWANDIRSQLRAAGRGRLANVTFHSAIVRLVRVADRPSISFACRCNAATRAIDWAVVDAGLQRGHKWIAV